MMRTVIIDDERKARNLLKAILADHCPDMEVMALCEDLPSGVKAIRKYAPQLIFLDVEMPGHSGLEIMEFFNDDEVDFKIIFVTAYNEFAIQAFKLSAVDYLLKPVDIPELLAAVKRFRKNESPELNLLRDNLSGNYQMRKMSVHMGQSIRYILLDDIYMIKGDGAYSEFYLKNNEKILASRHLKYFEEMLSPSRNFFRCHKSYLINTDYITEYIKSDGGRIILGGRYEASLSPDKVSMLLEKIQ